MVVFVRKEQKQRKSDFFSLTGVSGKKFDEKES